MTWLNPLLTNALLCRVFFLLVLPKSGYVPGLVVNPRKKVREWDFIKGFEPNEPNLGGTSKKNTMYYRSHNTESKLVLCSTLLNKKKTIANKSDILKKRIKCKVAPT